MDAMTPVTHGVRKILDRYEADARVLGTGGMSEYTFDANMRAMRSAMGAVDALHESLEAENDRLRAELDAARREGEAHEWAPESHYAMLPHDRCGTPVHAGDMTDRGEVTSLALRRDGRWSANVLQGAWLSEVEPRSLMVTARGRGAVRESEGRS